MCETTTLLQERPLTIHLRVPRLEGHMFPCSIRPCSFRGGGWVGPLDDHCPLQTGGFPLSIWFQSMYICIYMCVFFPIIQLIRYMHRLGIALASLFLHRPRFLDSHASRSGSRFSCRAQNRMQFANSAARARRCVLLGHAGVSLVWELRFLLAKERIPVGPRHSLHCTLDFREEMPSKSDSYTVGWLKSGSMGRSYESMPIP